MLQDYAMAGIRFENVTKRFGETLAVDNFSLEIADREFLVLVGPSGCGKSTILRMLSGLEELTEGKIFIGSNIVNDVAPKDRNIAMVFQTYALYPHMTVYDNMAFGLSLRKVIKDDIKRRVNQAASILGIEDLLKRKPRQLSGGQRQRVALGRAIVREPVAFLLDEPLSNLDAKLRVQTRTELSKLHQRLGTTFVYVTHDQTEAMTMATRIAVLDKGILQQVGTPQELYDRPDNLFVAGFIGSPAMNIFRAKVVNNQDGLYLTLNGIKIPVPAAKSRILTSHTDREVTFGIRPEDIYTSEYVSVGIEQSATISCKVEVTEMMGNELFIYSAMGKHQVLARVDPRTKVRPGDTVNLVLNMSRMYTFDPDNDKAIYT